MIKLGIERLEKYLYLFSGKNVGLITNPTGIDRNFKSTIDILNEKVKLTALFSPEHGVRGNMDAGAKLDAYVDDKTEIIVHSLYGATRRPSDEMMNNLDLVCIDIQDVRSVFTLLFIRWLIR